MQNEIKSYSSGSIGSTSKQFLLPSIPQLLLYALIGLLILVLLNLAKAWDYLNQNVLMPQGGAESYISQKSPWLYHAINSLSHSIILQVIFWVAVGCIVYIIIWFIRNIGINVLNDIAADNYVHPESYKRSRYWESVLARKIFFGISIILLITFIVSGARLMTSLANTSYRIVTTFHTLHNLLELVGTLLAATCLIYVLVLIAHLSINSWRFIYKDL